MRNQPSFNWNRRHHASQQSGLALIVVLSSLVFLSALAIAFIVGVGNELSASKSYAQGSNVRQLSETCANLVIAQIKTATAGQDNSGNDLAWASQPGMIRTYTTKGKMDRAFKLYSSTNMVTSTINLQVETNLISNWSTMPAHFTDLNAPVSPNPKNISLKVYPIMDPAAEGQVDGFTIGSRPAGVTTANMPVTWLYVLKNGQIVPPSLPAGATKTATVAGATLQNPIVGRIAFWTDDETCKVNINTASEGSYWDTPRVYTTEDLAYSTKQPTNKEYQRYSGHPAMTCLSTVFPSLNAETIYTYAPRVTGGTGTSLGGTVDYKALTTTLTLDKDRLYANADEYFFGPTRATHSIGLSELEQKRFFITASSRSPDVNLFNQPRVSIWPITRDRTTGNEALTVLDKAFKFCSSINGKPYYFQRQNSNSSTDDLPKTGGIDLNRNRTLLEYLRTLTTKDLPGYGGNLAGKYSSTNSDGGTDNDQILTEIFDYIRCSNLLDGSTGATSYAAPITNAEGGEGQVVPIVDSLKGTRGMGRFPTIGGAALLFIGTADETTNGTDTTFSGMLIPAVPVKKIRMQAALCVDLFDPSLGLPHNSPAYEIHVSGLDQFTWNSKSMGFPTTATISTPEPSMGYHEALLGGTTGFRRLMINKGSGSGASSYTLVGQETGRPNQIADLGKKEAFAFGGGDIKIEIFSVDSKKQVGAKLQTVTINFPSSSGFQSPSNISTIINTSFSSTQTSAFNFCSFFDPASRIASLSFSSSVLASTSVAPVNPADPPILGRFSSNAYVPMISRFDSIRGVSSITGDHRLVAARQTVGKEFFKEHTLYNDGTASFAHTLRNAMGVPFYGASGGKLVDVSYPRYATFHNENTAENRGFAIYPRDVSVLSTKGVGQKADWDNGIANFIDGPYINKPDEGDIDKSYKPYFGVEFSTVTLSQTFFSPNRMLPSAGMFGSLPTGIWSGTSGAPWQTLLFRPGPSGHPGLGSPESGPPFSKPPDYLYLDLFSMPVVEPYPISEPLSTAGRINMNYQIMPFTYINRATGLHAVLKSEKMIVISDSNASLYKTTQNANLSPLPTTPTSLRYDINIPLTLTQFDDRFATGDIYRSAAEICSIELVPKGATGAPTSGTISHSAMDTFWNANKLTGDNSRERPYANIYPRLTTKSNTYTVYYKVQTLQKVKTDPNQNTWSEGKDVVTGEYRGSTLIERYIDPNDASIPDYASNSTSAVSIDTYYKFRILNSKKFNP